MSGTDDLTGPEVEPTTSVEADRSWPAGWYPDPFERSVSRWYDGDEWTGRISDGASVGWDPSPLEVPAVPEASLPGLGAALVGAALGIALSFAVGALLHAADEPGGRTAELGLSSLALWSGLVGACVAVSARRGTGSILRDFGLRFRWLDLGLGFPVALGGRVAAAMFLAPIPLFPTRNLNEVDETVFEDALHGAGAWLVLVLVTCVGAPLVEELFFRGLLQTRLVARYGAAVGISVASLVFGAAHLMAWDGAYTLAYAWSIAGAGLVFGLARHHSGRLGTSIAAHAVFNAQAMLVLWALS